MTLTIKALIIQRLFALTSSNYSFGGFSADSFAAGASGLTLGCNFSTGLFLRGSFDALGAAAFGVAFGAGAAVSAGLTAALAGRSVLISTLLTGLGLCLGSLLARTAVAASDCSSAAGLALGFALAFGLAFGLAYALPFGSAFAVSAWGASLEAAGSALTFCAGIALASEFESFSVAGASFFTAFGFAAALRFGFAAGLSVVTSAAGLATGASVAGAVVSTLFAKGAVLLSIS